MDTILLAVLVGLQAATLFVVFIGTNFRDRVWQVPVIGGLLAKLVHFLWRSH